MCVRGRLKSKINRLEVLGQDTEFPLMIMSGISTGQSSAASWLKVAQLFPHNVFTLRYRSHPFTFQCVISLRVKLPHAAHNFGLGCTGGVAYCVMQQWQLSAANTIHMWCESLAALNKA